MKNFFCIFLLLLLLAVGGIVLKLSSATITTTTTGPLATASTAAAEIATVDDSRIHVVKDEITGGEDDDGVVAAHATQEEEADQQVALRGTDNFRPKDHRSHRELTIYATLTTVRNSNKSQNIHSCGNSKNCGPEGFNLMIGGHWESCGTSGALCRRYRAISVPWPGPKNGLNVVSWLLNSVISNTDQQDNSSFQNSRWYWDGDMLFTYASDHGHHSDWTKYCLDPEGPSTAAGTPLQVWQCKRGYSYHQWEFVSRTIAWGSYFETKGQIRLKNTNMCVQLMSDHDGGTLTLQNCNSSVDFQDFRIEKTGGPPLPYVLKVSGTNYVVRAHGGSAEGASVDMTANRNTHEMFYILRDDTDATKVYLKSFAHGTFLVESYMYWCPGFCHLRKAMTVGSQYVQIPGSTTTNYGHWELIDVGNYKYNIKNKLYGTYLAGSPHENGVVFAQHFASTYETWELQPFGYSL